MLEERIINLEIKISHQDLLVEQLNEIVTTQQAAIEMLQKDIKKLKISQSENVPQRPVNLSDEIPPHY